MELMIINVVACGLVLLLTVGQSDARQVRINRYATEVENDSNGDIGVRVTRLQPVPNTGIRPGRAFNISGSRKGSTEVNPLEQHDTFTTTESFELGWSTSTVGYDEQDTASTTQASVDTAKTPYPAAGYRPSRAFLLPTENQVTEGNIRVGEDDLSATLTTTSSSNSLDSTTSAPDSLATTESSVTTAAPEIADATTDSELSVTTEFADASLLTVTTSSPIASKTPYPPAGYRPSRAFLLPYEVPLQKNPDPTVAKHPVCGSSDFPLRPKPAPGTKEDPDAERVPVNAEVGPVIAAPVPGIVTLNERPLLEIKTQRLVVQPIFIARRPLVYSPPMPNW